jgi:hypothetical protein
MTALAPPQASAVLPQKSAQTLSRNPAEQLAKRNLNYRTFAHTVFEGYPLQFQTYL